MSIQQSIQDFRQTTVQTSAGSFSVEFPEPMGRLKATNCNRDKKQGREQPIKTGNLQNYCMLKDKDG
jgi:hypothetical protein